MLADIYNAINAKIDVALVELEDGFQQGNKSFLIFVHNRGVYSVFHAMKKISSIEAPCLIRLSNSASNCLR